MNYKKFLIILCAVLFFLAALTTYVNRVVFPRLIKKIAVQRLEEKLNRKVEIGSIRFNWVKGFVIDKIKIHEKGKTEAVFAQADQASFGIIFFPGFKHNRITVPYISVRSPSVHLIRTGEDTWNFSDLFAAPAAAENSPAPAAEKASNVEIAWGGIAISDGRMLVEDRSQARPWGEFLDRINLKLALSYKGISYDFTAYIPRGNGFAGATVYYQPLTKDTQAQIHLKNIDTAQYLSLINIPDVRVASGIIEQIDLNISHTQNKTSAQGDLTMKTLDITSQDQNFKGDIQIRGLDAQYQEGDITARGQLSLSHVRTRVPGLSAGGSVQAGISAFELTPESLAFVGSLQAQNIFVDLKDRTVKVSGVNLDNIKIRKDKDGIQSVGSIRTRGLCVQWPDQKLQGDITLKAVTMRMKDSGNISLEGELQADRFYSSLEDQTFRSGHILLENARLDIADGKNISLGGKLSLADMALSFEENVFSSASLETGRLSVHLNDGIIKASATMNASKAKLVLNRQKTIEADPRLELSLQMPLNAPQEMIYKGSVTLSDGHIRGFAPLPQLDNFELDADFRNDEAVINAFSVNILDTSLHMTGTVKNFKDPLLNITADADDLNLAKMNDLSLPLVSQYGLTFDGTSFVKLQFAGSLSDPSNAKILAVASVKNVSIASSKLHQRIRNITGIIEATPDSVKWRDMTAVYLGQKYTLDGSMDGFKNPRIFTTLEGPLLQLKADIAKDGRIITVNSLAGKFMGAPLNSTGSITLAEGREPVFDISTTATVILEDLIQKLPEAQKKNFQFLDPAGIVSITADLKGSSADWKRDTLNALVTCPVVRLKGYKLTDMKIHIDSEGARIRNLTFDGNFYDGSVHAVGSLDLLASGLPYDLAFNIDHADLHQFKMDSPFKMNEINGKFYFTSIAHGTLADLKKNLHATGSLAIRDGFLGEFNLFKGLLDVLNDSISLSKVMITDVEANFKIDDEKINTDNLRLKGPTIVLLGKGWVSFDQTCDLNMTVDLSSGIFPAMAHDVLQSLSIRVYDKISAPKFKKKISVPQVINTLLKNLWQ